MSTAELLAPYAHVAGLKSKNLRDAFIDAVNDVVGATTAHTDAVKLIVAKLHNASLLIDDIEDSAVRRRGQPAAHIIFGTPLTMNAANMIIFEALADCIVLDRGVVGVEKVTGTTPFDTAVVVFQSELALLHHGQGQDIFWRDTNSCPTDDEYRAMVTNKTGGLFRLAVRLVLLGAPDAALRAAAEAPLLAFTDRVSYLFQVLDDLLNLSSSDYHEKKTFCEDLTEGKFSFLTTHAVAAAARRTPGDTRLLRLLQTRPQEVDVKRFCLGLMLETGTFDHTRRTIDRLAEECAELLTGVENAMRPKTVDGPSDSADEPTTTAVGSRDGDAVTRSPAKEAVPSFAVARLRKFVDRLSAAVPRSDPPAV